jgi:hypothetical protein
MSTVSRVAQRLAGRDNTPPLRERDVELLQARAIDPAVAAERGYRTAPGNLRQLGFSQTQAALGDGLLIPVHTIDGDVAYSLFRPDTPRETGDGKAGPKYEVPAGQRLVIDAHPRIRHELGNPHVALLICESAPKADACISAGYVAIAVNGVWGWRGTNACGGKTVLPDFEAIALNDRAVVLTFDSDVWTNHHVADAVERLGAFLDRKARVRVCRIPPMADGKKQGVDDYIAAGGDVSQLLADAVPLGQFLDERPRLGTVEDDSDAGYCKACTLAAEEWRRQFLAAMRCPNPSVRKAVPTLAALHFAFDAAVSRDANRDPRFVRSLAEDGSMRITRRTLAEIAGRSESTITNDLQLLEEHGCLSRSVVRLFPGDVDPDTGEIVGKPKSILRVMPLRSATANFRYLANVPKPDAEQQERSWGGRREACASCGSTRLEVTCLDCGHRQDVGAPSPEKPIGFLKAQDALSGLATDETLGNRPTQPPHTTKKSILPFQESDGCDGPGTEKAQDALLARRRALREPRTRPRQARFDRDAPTTPRLPLDERIVAAVTAATTRKQPLHEDEVARVVDALPRDVRPVLRVLAGQRRLKHWDDGILTAAPVSTGAD